MASLLSMLTAGMRMSIGPFVIPMSEGLGVSRGWFSAVVALGMLFYGVGMPIAGYYVTKFGTRSTLLLGASLVSVSLVTTVYASNSFMFLFSYGVLLSIGFSFMSSVALTLLISRWFIKYRAVALLLFSSGAMAGIAVMSPLFTEMIKFFGWQQTILIYAFFLFAFTLFLVFVFIRDAAPEYADLDERDVENIQHTLPKKETNVRVAGLRFKKAMAMRPFWLINLGAFACGFSMNLLGTHAVPMLIDHGFTAEVSAYGVSLIGFIAIFSTVMMGRIAVKVEHRYILVSIFFVRAIAFFALAAVATPVQLYAVTFIGGWVWTGNMALASGMIADMYGVKRVGLLYSWTFFIHQIGATLSTWLGGWAYEVYHTHWVAFGTAGVFLLIASFVSLLLPRNVQYKKCFQL